MPSDVPVRTVSNRFPYATWEHNNFTEQVLLHFHCAAMDRRRDPYDGKTQTLQEMVKKYQGTYSKSEVESYFEFECTVASAPASAPAKPASNEIEGLRQWLKEKGRESQFDQVSSWCEENGAVLLEEAPTGGCLI